MRDRVRVSPLELPQNVHEAVRAGRPAVLITLHRRELSVEELEAVCNTVAVLARQFQQAVFIWPVHLSPRISSIVHLLLSDRENIFLIHPLGYASLIYLLDKCHFVISDSGGIQEEAPSFGKEFWSCVKKQNVLRPLKLASASCWEQMWKHCTQKHPLLLSSPTPPEHHAANPFGDGHAAERIVQSIKDLFIMNN